MEMTYNSKNNTQTFLIIALLGLLGLNAYQWYSNNNLTTTTETQKASITNLEKAQAELDTDYQAALGQLEGLRGDNKVANDLIDSQKRELLAQKSKISELIWTKKELGQAKSEMAKLNQQVTQYVAEVNSLKAENTSLKESNVQLNTANQTLTTTLDTEVKAKEEVTAAKNALATEKAKLAEENKGLSTKVDMANAIKINFMDVKGFDVKDDGKLKGKDKAKDIEMLRICMTTETNLVTPSGNKKFFIRVVTPTGETLAQDDKGSGTVTNKLDNSTVRYTTSADINYENKDTNACIDWTLTNKLAKGAYGIEMYNNGFMVGKGSFNLK
jgi:cytoskeletal protein RodZ